MNRRTALAVVLLAATLVGCDEEVTPRGAASPLPTPSASAAVARVDAHLPADLSGLPWTDVGLPRRMPTGRESMTSLLDAPPGRVLMSYRPVESWDDPTGWASETIYLLGADERWRRLAMADLGLDEAWWPGPDTYGAGEVSPDGRRWAAHVGNRVLVVDLRTGEHRLSVVGDGRTDVRFVRWLPDGRTVQAYSSGTDGAPRFNITHLVPVSGDVRVSPYGRLAVAFEPDGTAVRFGRVARFRWADEDAEPIQDRVPRFWNVGRGSYTAMHGDRFSIVPIFREAAEVHDLLSVDRETLQPVARLVNRRGGFLGRGEGLGVSYGWLDSGTVLLSTTSWVVTWSPAEGRLATVARMPTVPHGVWAAWSASFALDLLREHSGR